MNDEVKFRCEVCNLLIYDPVREIEFQCSDCGSKYLFTEAEGAKLIKSGIKFDFVNMALAIGYSAFVIFMLWNHLMMDKDWTFIGFILILFPLSMLFRNLIFGNDGRKDLLGLYFRLFAGNIRHFDIGSKLLIFTLVIGQIIGLILLLLVLI